MPIKAHQKRYLRRSEKMNEEYIETNIAFENWNQDPDSYKIQILLTLANIELSLRKIANYFDHK